MAKCVRDDVELEEAEIDYEYDGVVIRGVKALRCPVCGQESIDLDQYEEIKRRIEALIKPLKLRRKISAAGRRPVLYMPDDIVKAAKIKVGDEVEIHMEGRRIVIEPVEEVEAEQ